MIFDMTVNSPKYDDGIVVMQKNGVILRGRTLKSRGVCNLQLNSPGTKGNYVFVCCIKKKGCKKRAQRWKKC